MKSKERKGAGGCLRSTYSMLLGEIQLLMTVMRRNWKWKTDPMALSKNQGFNANTYIQSLQKLRWSLPPVGTELRPTSVVHPFVEIIKAEDTTGLATGLAIASLQKLLEAGFFGAEDEGALEALRCVVDALTHCQFDATESRRDELVLMKMLQAQAACLSCGAGRSLPGDDVWCMIQTCYRVYKVMRPPDYSDLLCEAAESILRQMVTVVFTESRWCSGEHDDSENEAKEESRGGGGGAQQGTDEEKEKRKVKGASYSSVLGSSPATITSYSSAVTTSSSSSSSVAAAAAAAAASYSSSSSSPFAQEETKEGRGNKLSCAERVMELVCSLCNTPTMKGERRDQSTNAQTLGCQLLLSILEADNDASAAIWDNRRLIHRVEDDVCYFLAASCAASGNPLILSFALRIIYLLHTHTSMRTRLRAQEEVFLSRVYAGTLDRKQGLVPYEIREALIESLLDFARIPWFFQDLFANFDCQANSEDLCSDLLAVLCRAAHPAVQDPDAVLNTNHVLALNVLVEVLESIHQGVKGRRRGADDSKAAAAPRSSSAWKDSRLHSLYTAKAAINQCVIAFNQKPKAGIRMMAECGILSQGITLKDEVADREFDAYLKDLAKHNKGVFNRNHRARKDRRRECEELMKQEGLSFEEAEARLGPISLPKHPPPPIPNPKLRMVQREREIRKDAVVLAELLRNNPLVDLTVVGEFLGAPLQFTHMVRKAFSRTFDFAGLSIDVALRTYLEAFRLPKEAQQIDRVLLSFSAAFHRANPTYMHSEDGVYTLVFSIIMLTTDLHNPLVPKKMSLDQYLVNTRGIDDGDDVPREELERLYRTIARRQIAMSGRGSGATISAELWRDILHRAATFERPPYRPLGCVDPAVDDMDREIFLCLWEPLLDVLDATYWKAKQEHVVALVERGYSLMAGLGARFQRSDILGKIFGSVAGNTGLVPSTESKADEAGGGRQESQEALIRFAGQPNSLRAVKTFYAMVVTYGSQLPCEFWESILQSLLRLQDMEVLPKAIATVNDFVSGPRSRDDILTLIPAKYEEPQEAGGMVSSLLSTMSSLFAPSPVQDPRERMERHAKLHPVAKRCVTECPLDLVLPATKRVRLDVLLGLLSAIARMCDVGGLVRDLHTMCWHDTLYMSTRRKHTKKLFESRLTRRQSGAKRLGVTAAAAAPTTVTTTAAPADNGSNASGSGSSPHQGAQAANTSTTAVETAETHGANIEQELSAIIRRVTSEEAKTQPLIFEQELNEEMRDLSLWIEQKRGLQQEGLANGRARRRIWTWENDGWLPKPLKDTLLLVHFFTQISLHNQHRFREIYPAIRRFLSGLVKLPSEEKEGVGGGVDLMAKSETKGTLPAAVLEAAVVSTLVICSQMLDNEETVPLGINLLEFVGTIDDRQSMFIAEQLSYGLLFVVNEHRAAINTVRGWQCVLELLTRGLRSPSTSFAGLKTLAIIVACQKCRCLSFQLFRQTVETVSKYVVAMDSEIPINLLYILHKRLTRLIQDVPPHERKSFRTGNSQQVVSWNQMLWNHCWKPLLSELSSLIWKLPHPRSGYALQIFQQLLLSPELPGGTIYYANHQPKLPMQTDVRNFWQNSMVQIIIPFLEQLAEKKNEDRVILNHVRQRSLNLMVKIFLQKLPTLLSFKSFPTTLVKVIVTIRRYILIGKGKTLGEMALEALKNLMLVMSSTGAFSPEHNPAGKELSELAWSYIDPDFPGLREELFPLRPQPRNQTQPQPKGQDSKNNQPVENMVVGAKTMPLKMG